MLTTPLSVIAGIVLGEYSVKSGWFNSETMLYMAFVTIANYSMTSFELGYALKFMRVLLLILTFSSISGASLPEHSLPSAALSLTGQSPEKVIFTR